MKVTPFKMYSIRGKTIKLQRRDRLAVFVSEVPRHDLPVDDVIDRVIVGNVHLRVFAHYLRQSLFKPCSKGIRSIVEQLLLNFLGAFSLGSQLLFQVF